MSDYLSMGSNACYSIQLQGALGQNWAEQFGDLTVVTLDVREGSRSPVTTIVGELVDQAALFGLLNLLYDLGLPLLSVNYLGHGQQEVP